VNTKGKHLILAVGLGLIALFANKLYIESTVEQYKNTKVISVLRAKELIRAGTPLTNKLISVARVPESYSPRARILDSNRGDFLGQELAVDVLKGDYILENYFSTRAAVGNTLSQNLEGAPYRAVNLPVDDVNSLANSIVAGDHIDIVLTFTEAARGQKVSTVFMQNVPVISTGQYSPAAQELGSGPGRGRRAQGYNSLTLKLTAQDAIRLNYARQVGKLSILLRSQRDDKLLAVPPISSISDVLSADDKLAIGQSVQKSSQEAESSADNNKLKAQLKEMLELQQKQKQSAR